MWLVWNFYGRQRVSMDEFYDIHWFPDGKPKYVPLRERIIDPYGGPGFHRQGW